MMEGIEELKDRVAARISSLRKIRKMSQRQLAEACGMHRMAINAIEAGSRSIKLTEAAAIAEALGVELGPLVSDEPLVLHVHTEVPID
jgi:transcriptional regulator with XRE-family HTH domain